MSPFICLQETFFTRNQYFLHKNDAYRTGIRKHWKNWELGKENFHKKLSTCFGGQDSYKTLRAIISYSMTISHIEPYLFIPPIPITKIFLIIGDLQVQLQMSKPNRVCFIRLAQIVTYGKSLRPITETLMPSLGLQFKSMPNIFTVKCIGTDS